MAWPISAPALVTIGSTAAWNGDSVIAGIGGRTGIETTMGQTFTVPASNSVLNSVKFWVTGTLLEETINFSIYVAAWDRDRVSGPILYRSPMLNPGPSGPAHLNLAPFEVVDLNLSLSAGRQYVAFISVSEYDGDSRASYAALGGMSVNGYPGGNLVTLRHGPDFEAIRNTAWSFTAGWDLAFEATFQPGETGGEHIGDPGGGDTGRFVVDPQFSPEILRDRPGGYAMARQPDGKILVVGNFLRVGESLRAGVVRFNANGSLDETFECRPGIEGGIPVAIALQPDGRVLVGGHFTRVNGVARAHVARLNHDGSLDLTFNPGTGANGAVYALALRPDGRVVVGGDFTTFDGVDRGHLALLHPDGTLDQAFAASVENPAFGASVYVRAILLGTDDTLVVGGRFARANGEPRVGLARFRGDGSLDTRFRANLARESEYVMDLDQRPGGPLFVAGSFSSINGLARRSVASLGSSGDPTASFRFPTAVSFSAWTVEAAADGGAWLGGSFSAIGDPPRQRVARLNAAGEVDGGFDAGDEGRGTVYDLISLESGALLVSSVPLAGGTRMVEQLRRDGGRDTDFQTQVSWSRATLNAVLPLADGRCLIAGDFSRVNGLPRRNVARLYSNGTLDPSFDAGESSSHAISTLGVHADGRILVGGIFSRFAGETQRYLARLAPSGALDRQFKPEPSGAVAAIQVLPDDRVLVGGDFLSMGQAQVSYLARLNAEGSLDRTFNAGVFSSGVRAIAPLTDGGFLIAGRFSSVNQVSRTGMARLGPDGALVDTFEPVKVGIPEVTAVAALSDGSVAFGGLLYSVAGGGEVWRTLVRLGPAGNLIKPLTTGDRDSVNALVAADEGRVWYGAGVFPGSANLAPVRRLGILDSQGDLDLDLYSGGLMADQVLALALGAGGSLMVAGDFIQLDGQSRYGLARLVSAGDEVRLSLVGLGTAHLEFELKAPTGTYQIEISRDLRVWEAAHSVTMITSSAKLTEPLDGNGARFYRVARK